MELRRMSEDANTRIALYLEGNEASGLSVHDLEMRIGSVPVRMGGIGGGRHEI